MMPGIITVLADEHYERVETLWQQLKQTFGISFILKGEIPPHFSYHVAEAYETEPVVQMLEKLAGETAVFELKTAGVGIFTSADPVIYIPVVTSPTLVALHQTLWQQIETFVTNPQDYYAPFNWFPHITLAQKDVGAEQIGEVVHWLNAQPLYWTIRVENLTFVDEVGSATPTRYSFDLQP